MRPDVRNYLVTQFYSVGNPRLFVDGLQQAVNSVGDGGVFTGDNLFTFNKNLSFLRDEAFMKAFNAHITNKMEQAAIWRTYTLCWAAKRSLHVPGDFVECACYMGTTARVIVDYLQFASSDRQYYLYDLFEHSENDKHHSMDEHGPDLYARVSARFADFPNVHVTRGKVPEVLETVAPQSIAMMHIDLNSAEAEVAALEFLYDRLSPGGTIVLDDYGWLPYQQQKFAEDKFFSARGYDVLELPTGQGLIIK